MPGLWLSDLPIVILFLGWHLIKCPPGLILSKHSSPPPTQPLIYSTKNVHSKEIIWIKKDVERVQRCRLNRNFLGLISIERAGQQKTILGSQPFHLFWGRFKTKKDPQRLGQEQKICFRPSRRVGGGVILTFLHSLNQLVITAWIIWRN